jgi:hypothetical protein
MITLLGLKYVLTLDGYRIGTFDTYDEAYSVWSELVNHMIAA